MSAPFVEHPVHRQRRVSKNLIVKHITVCTNEIYQLDLKEIFLNCSTEGAMLVVSKTKIFLQTAGTINKIYR